MITEIIPFEEMTDQLISSISEKSGKTVQQVNDLEPELHPDMSDGAVVSYTGLFKDGNSVSQDIWTVNGDDGITAFIDP